MSPATPSPPNLRVLCRQEDSRKQFLAPQACTSRPAFEGRGEFRVVVAHVRAPGWERQFEATDDDLVKLAVLTVYAKSNAAIRHADR
jgi:hypothetical protein